MNAVKSFALSALLASCSLGAVCAQSGQSAQSANQTVNNDPAAASKTVDDAGSYATGKPLEMQSKEGFFGHLNPFARKKWVHRQIDPVRDRANELDHLQAKNANDIRDVDARSTAGVNRAMSAANAADAHAADAAGRADRANSTASAANARTTSLNGTVANLDQYQQISATSLPFVAGHTTLTTRQKANLDGVATSLAAEKGYIVEVQGYSRSGVAASQAMADSVVRYLVTEHQVPVYRIYRTGMGKTVAASTADGSKALTNGVRVTVLHNSLSTLGTANPTTGTSN